MRSAVVSTAVQLHCNKVMPGSLAYIGRSVCVVLDMCYINEETSSRFWCLLASASLSWSQQQACHLQPPDTVALLHLT